MDAADARAREARTRGRVGGVYRTKIVRVYRRARSRRACAGDAWCSRLQSRMQTPCAVSDLYPPRSPGRGCVRVRAQGNAVSSGYAAALVDACKSGGVLEQVHADMETLDAYVKANAAVAGFLANPTMAVEKKKDILAKLGKEAGFHAFTSNFLNLLVDKKRENQLETIIAEFETLFCEATDTQVR